MTILQAIHLPGNKSLMKQSNELSIELIQRKDRALKIIDDSKLFISSGDLTNELNEHIDALKNQEMKLSNHQAIVILLDYAERELVAIEKLSKGKPKSLFQLFLELFK